MGWFGTAFNIATSLYGAKRGKDQARIAARQQEYARREELAFLREQYEADMRLQNQTLGNTMAMQNYAMSMNARNNAIAAQERGWDINYIERMLGIKNQEQLRELMRQQDLDTKAMQDFARQYEDYVGKANMSKQERQEAKQELEQFKRIVERERAYEEGSFELARDQMMEERDFDIQNFHQARAQAMQERTLDEERRMALEREIRALGGDMESLQRSFGTVPRRYYDSSDVQAAADRRFSNVEAAFDEEVENMMSKLSAAQKAQGFGGISATGIGDAATETQKARLIAKLASDKAALKNQAYDQAMAEIQGYQGMADARFNQEVGYQNTRLQQLLGARSPEIEMMMQLPKSGSAVYDRAIQSGAFHQPISSTASTLAGMQLQSGIYDRDMPIMSSLMTNLNIPTRTWDANPRSAITDFIDPPTITPRYASSSGLEDFYKRGSGYANDNYAGAVENYGQSRTDLYNMIKGGAQSIYDSWNTNRASNADSGRGFIGARRLPWSNGNVTVGMKGY